MNNVALIFEEWKKNPLPDFFINDKSNAIFCTKNGIVRQLATIKNFPSMIFIAVKEHNGVVIKTIIVNGDGKDA